MYEMDFGVADWAMVGERLTGGVCVRASATLWSRDCERWHRASAWAIVKASYGYELVMVEDNEGVSRSASDEM